MQTEIESSKGAAEHIEGQMDLLERKISGIVGEVSRLKSENIEVTQERDALADKVRQLEERLSEADSAPLEGALGELREENELLLHERESIARRIGELLDKLDLLST